MDLNRNLPYLPAYSLTAAAVTLTTAVCMFYFPVKASLIIAVSPLALLFFLYAWFRPYIIILLLTALIPLDSLICLPGVSKQISFFKLLFPLPLTVFVIGLAIRRFEFPPINGLDKWILGWTILYLFLIPNAVDKPEAFNFFRKFISMVMLYFMITYFCNTPERFNQLKYTVLFSTLLSVLIGIFTYFTGANPFTTHLDPNLLRTTGATGMDPNTYAASLFLPLGLAAACALSTEKVGRRLFFFALSAVLVAGISLTFSRSALLVTGLMFCCALILWHEKLTPIHWILILIAMTAGLIFMPHSICERITSLGQALLNGPGQTETSLLRRSNYLIVGWNIFKEYPVFGAGPGNFSVLHAMPSFQPLNSLVGVQRLPHNLYLQVITETGIIGMIFFAGITGNVVGTLWGSVKKNYSLKDSSRGVLLSVIGIMAMGMFLHMLLTKLFWLILVFTRLMAENNK